MKRDLSVPMTNALLLAEKSGYMGITKYPDLGWRTDLLGDKINSAVIYALVKREYLYFQIRAFGGTFDGRKVETHRTALLTEKAMAYLDRLRPAYGTASKEAQT